MVTQFTWTCIFEFRHRLMYSRLRFVYQSAAKNRLRLDEKMMFCKFQSLGSSIINNDAKLAWIFQRSVSDTYMSTYWCLTHMVQWGKLIVEKDQASKSTLSTLLIISLEITNHFIFPESLEGLTKSKKHGLLSQL